MSLAGFDFLDASDDLEETTEEATETPEEAIEAEEAEEGANDGAQDELTDEESGDDSDDDEGPEVIFIDDEEVTLDQIKEWKAGNLREQDYTKKTMALAEERKAVASKLSELSNIAETLTAGEQSIKKLLVGELDDIDLKALREDDYPEYLKVKETIKEREAKFDELKETALNARKQYYAEQGKQLSDALGWDDKSKSERDVDAYKDLAKEYGFDNTDQSSLTSAKVMKALIEFAHMKKSKLVEPPKGKPKKTKFKSSSATPKAKPKTQEERINNFFS